MKNRLTSNQFEDKTKIFLCTKMKMNSETKYFIYILKLLCIVFNHAQKNEYCVMRIIYSELSQNTGLTFSTAKIYGCRFMSDFRNLLSEKNDNFSFSKAASAYMLYELVKFIDKRYGLEEL